MRAALGLALIASVAATGCRSEEEQQADFREQFQGQCVQAIREQPSTPAGLDPDRVCDCVAGKLFTGKTTAEIVQIVNEQRGVTQATTQCALEQLGGAQALRSRSPAVAQADGTAAGGAPGEAR